MIRLCLIFIHYGNTQSLFCTQCIVSCKTVNDTLGVKEFPFSTIATMNKQDLKLSLTTLEQGIFLSRVA